MTELAVAMLRHIEPQRHGAKMRDLTQELDWGFRVAILEFPIGRTHSTDRFDFAMGAFRKLFRLALPNP